MLTTILLVSLGAILLVVWAFSALSIVVALRRADRARLARFSIDARTPPTDLRTVLLYSLFLSVNTVTFVAARGWYKLRRKPLPAKPADR